MKRNLYQSRPLATASFFQKLFGQHPEENGIIELNNLLATKEVLSISLKDVLFIEQKYKLSLTKEFRLNMEEFYAVYLNHCLTDKILSQQEVSELSHLKHILNLDDRTINSLHAKVGGIVYRQSFRDAVADGKLTEDETHFLTELANTLELPKALTDKIALEASTAFVENYVSKIVADQRLSPAEEQELQAISRSLNVPLDFNEQTKEQLRKLKRYWAIENLPLMTIDCDIALQKSEICHLSIPNVSWYELRNVRTHTNYVGYTTSIKIAKGFYLHSGSRSSKSYTTEALKLIDRGTLYLTNKRILFAGTKKNNNIRIDRVLSFTPYTDGVEIGKDAGKCPTLQLPQHADIFCMILERLLNER